MGNEAVHCALLGRDAFNIFGGDLVDPFDDVLGYPVEGHYQGAVAAEVVGARHHEVIGILGDADGEVGFGGAVLPEGGEGG